MHQYFFAEGLVALSPFLFLFNPQHLQKGWWRDAFQVPRHQLKRPTGAGPRLAPGKIFASGQIFHRFGLSQVYRVPATAQGNQGEKALQEKKGQEELR